MLNRTIEHNTPIAPSELIITEEGKIYHLNLHPNDIADDIIVVGDQNRVKRISQHFDSIEIEVENREFVTHTGMYNGKRLTVLSTGIGCDNIDIVINELDALVNIDFNLKTTKKEHTQLNIIRLGTSGSLQADIPVDSFVISEYGLGFDGLAGFYDGVFEKDELLLKEAFDNQINWGPEINPPYFAKGSSELIQKLEEGMHKGITATANGFYGPQGRSLRLAAKIPNLNEQLNEFKHNGFKITNFEMETSALYALSGMLGHNACTVCAIIANRFKGEYSKDYKLTVDKLIQLVLTRLTT